MLRNLSLSTLVFVIALSGCATMSGDTRSEKRDSVLKMKREVLAKLYSVQPEAKKVVSSAPGYAVFSNVNVHIIFAGFGGGYGVVKNNQTGKYTYMKMGEAGVGLGLGVKDFRGVFVFHDNETMDKFVEQGWVFAGQADAAAKSGEKGDAVASEASFSNITIYQLTESGLALQATVKGTKYWKDDELN